jgi:hypothetical protein
MLKLSFFLLILALSGWSNSRKFNRERARKNRSRLLMAISIIKHVIAKSDCYKQIMRSRDT